MDRTIVIAVKTQLHVNYKKLIPFQDGLKTLSEDRYAGLKTQIIENGFSFAIHVWRDEYDYYILDGHQRREAVRRMVEEECWICPDLPVVVVGANNYLQAKHKLIAGASTYGEVHVDKLVSQAKQANINAEDLLRNYNFPSIKTEEIYKQLQPAHFSDITNYKGDPLAPDKQDNQPDVSDVRIVQLFLNVDNIKSFNEKINKLASLYKTKGVTATIIRAIEQELENTSANAKVNK